MKRLGELALYTAAAGSALALAPGAEASIIYSGIHNITVHRVDNGYSTASVDLNGNGQGDMALSISSYAYGGAQLNVTGLFGFPGTQPGSFGSAAFFNNASNNDLLKLTASSRAIGANYGTNISVGPFGPMRGLYAGGGYSSVFGLWDPGAAATTTGFAGVRIGSYYSGTKQFGWLHFKLSTDSQNRTASLTLIDWAFESVPGKSIHVGAGVPVPEPSGLGLMALGAVGLAALRRRRRGGRSCASCD